MLLVAVPYFAMDNYSGSARFAVKATQECASFLPRREKSESPFLA